MQAIGRAQSHLVVIFIRDSRWHEIMVGQSLHLVCRRVAIACSSPRSHNCCSGSATLLHRSIWPRGVLKIQNATWHLFLQYCIDKLFINNACLSKCSWDRSSAFPGSHVRPLLMVSSQQRLQSAPNLRKRCRGRQKNIRPKLNVQIFCVIVWAGPSIT